MIKLLPSSLVLFIVLLTSSCATIIHGNKQDVFFSSTPPRALIFIDGQEIGTTPKMVELNRLGRKSNEPYGKKGYLVEIKLEGYYPIEVKITRGIDGWFFGNFLCGNIIGIVFDAASGSMYKLKPDEIITYLSSKNKEANVVKDGSLFVAVDLEINPAWEKFGALQVK